MIKRVIASTTMNRMIAKLLGVTLVIGLAGALGLSYLKYADVAREAWDFVKMIAVGLLSALGADPHDTPPPPPGTTVTGTTTTSTAPTEATTAPVLTTTTTETETPKALAPEETTP